MTGGRVEPRQRRILDVDGEQVLPGGGDRVRPVPDWHDLDDLVRLGIDPDERVRHDGDRRLVSAEGDDEHGGNGRGDY